MTDPKIPPKAKKPNVRTVATRAGVSVATVSRVLTGSAKVAPTTRDRVQQAMDALGFVPSPAARAINSGRTHLIGALIPTLDHSIFARFVDALERRLDDHGLSLLVATTGYDATREYQKAAKLLHLGVEGVVVSGVTRAPEFDPLIARHKVPVVATSYFDATYNYPTVAYDNGAVARMALDHLVGLGHRYIAVFTGPLAGNDRARARLAAVRAADTADLEVVEMAQDLGTAADAVENVLRKGPQVTAILCFSDILAQGALIRLKALGHTIPGDMSVIGIEDLPSSASFDPPLTTIHLPVAQMGRGAADAIQAQLSGGPRQPGRCLPVTLVQRATTGPPKRP